MFPKDSDLGFGAQLLAIVLTFALGFLINVWFVKWGLNIGMPELMAHAGGAWHAISWSNAAEVTLMLWFIGGALVGLNTTSLARRSDV